MEELDKIIKDLELIGSEIFNKFGTESYNIRCELHDIKEKLRKIKKNKRFKF